MQSKNTSKHTSRILKAARTIISTCGEYPTDESIHRQAVQSNVCENALKDEVISLALKESIIYENSAF